MQPAVVLSTLALNAITVASGLLLAAGAVLVAVHLVRRRRQEDPNVWWGSPGRPSRSPANAVAGADGLVPRGDRPTGLRALIVDDDDSVRELCEQTLADDGYEVVTAASAEEALELLAVDDEVHDPGITILEVGLVITDLKLPGMSGADLARELTERDPSVPVMFTSGYDPSDFGVDPETAAFLPKPFTPGQLLEACRAAVLEVVNLRRKQRAISRFDYEKMSDSYEHTSNSEIASSTRFSADGTPIRPRVLVVEDDDSVRALCEQTLADEGYEVVTAASGREALELVATLGGVDLLVSDLNSSSARDTAADVVLPGTDRVTLDELLAASRWHNLRDDGEADDPGSTGRKSGSPILLDGAEPVLVSEHDDRPPVEGEIARNDAGGGPAAGDAGIGVLLMSGHDPADVGVDPDELAFLAKPFAPEQLIAAADECLRDSIGTIKSRVKDAGAQAAVAGAEGAAGMTEGRKGLHAVNVRRADVSPVDERMRGDRMRGDAGDDDMIAWSRDDTVTDRTALVGFGSFSASRKRLAAVTATVGVAILIAGGIALAISTTGQVRTEDSTAAATIDRGDGTPDDRAAESQPAAAASPSTDPSTEDADPEPTSGTTGSSPEPSRQLAAEPDPQTTLDVDPDPEQQSSSEPQPVQESSPDPSPEATPESSTEPEPAVAYSEPSKDAPVLASCSSQYQADGTTTYTVQFTVQFSGGDYDVLPHEPFVDNDETVEVRGGTLTWDVTATHMSQRGDGDTFEVTAPSEFGWADPGSDERSHTHLPPALTVHTDRCGH